MRLTHEDERGNARMVNISSKEPTLRTAKAEAIIILPAVVCDALANHMIKKGDALSVAQIAGTNAAKLTPFLIPLCHPLKIDDIDVKCFLDAENSLVKIETEVCAFDRTGVEMEALTAASVAALTLYDMCKGVDKGMVIKEIKLLKKSGGKSGDYVYRP